MRKAHEVTSCLLGLRPLTQAKGLEVDKIFFSRVKRMRRLGIRERETRRKRALKINQTSNL